MNPTSTLPAIKADTSQKDVEDLAGGALVNLVGKIGRLGKGTFIWVVTFLFGTHILGLYEQAWAIIGALQRVATFGLHRGVVKLVVEAGVKEDEAQVHRFLTVALVSVLISSAAITAVTLLAIDWIARFYGSQELGRALAIMVWAMPLLSLAAVFIAATRALRIMRIDVYVNSIAGPMILLVAGSAAGFLQWGLPGLAVAQVLMAIGACGLAAYFFQRYYSPRRCLSSLRERLPWAPMLLFSLPNMVNDLLTSIVARLDILMLPAFVEPTSVGIYAIARRVSSVLLKLPESFDPIFSSVVSSLAFREEHEQLGDRFGSIARWTLIISLPLLAGMLFVGGQLLLFFDVDSAASIHALIVLSTGMALFGLLAPGESLLIMAGKPYSNLIIKMAWLGLAFALHYWLIPHYGILGAALATAISMNAINAIRMARVFSAYKAHPFSLSLLKPLGAAAVAFAVVGAGRVTVGMVSFWFDAGSLVCFLVIYGVVLRALGLKREDRMLLELMGRRIREWRWTE